MKLPNGYGSIYKAKGNRRNPYIVRVTVNLDSTGKQNKKTLGYVKDYKSGLLLLANYHNDPYNLNFKNITFSDIWEEVLKNLNNLVQNNKMSESNVKGLISMYKNHCKALYNEKILDLKYKKMQNILDDLNLGHTAKGFFKTVCVKIFEYAINEYELPIKINPAIKLKVGEYEKSELHSTCSEDEIKLLWKNSENDIVKIFLIMCYTGMRPNELFNILRTNIFLEKEYMVGGSKTKAGKNRIIPIHYKIKPYIIYFLKKDSEYPFKTIIDKFNYGKFRRLFDKKMLELNIDHTPYDGRHTFSTRMKNANANEYIVKRIMGHSIQDITENTYTHRDYKYLVEEVNKLT